MKRGDTYPDKESWTRQRQEEARRVAEATRLQKGEDERARQDTTEWGEEMMVDQWSAQTDTVTGTSQGTPPAIGRKEREGEGEAEGVKEGKGSEERRGRRGEGGREEDRTQPPWNFDPNLYGKAASKKGGDLSFYLAYDSV